METQSNYQALEMCATMLPLSILMIRNDKKRQLITEIYLQHRLLMYKVACQFFHNQNAEADDAVSAAVEQLCEKSDRILAIECNKRASYIVSMVRNVCLSRLRKLKRQHKHVDFGPDGDALENVPGDDDVQEMVFSRMTALDMLDVYAELSERDRELIRLRHMDQMNYEDIAVVIGLSESSTRTAVSRAKKRLKQLAEKKRNLN
ncbi:MAG TPA: sigma-70 family RNA polymerase sigma factor [Candidatus Limiplasma sp.]|nr:sigma-70 family RNA polymerase sigma factor [Candidatus Limiplasma sp.]HRX07541.1 sigma-70 family RNA polymerase sigma factor [Candidatus Limiplasma sp.]